MLQDINPKASINIFFHQIDNDLSGEEKSSEIWRIFIENLEDKIDNNPLSRTNTSQLNYYLTSIYDHSILETMSKIVSKIVAKQIKILPKMMNDISSVKNSSFFNQFWLFLALQPWQSVLVRHDD